MTELPNIVSRRLRSAASEAAHPDTDLLTAFAEKSLTQREQTDVLKHLAQCGDCREVVALALPEQIDAMPIKPVAGRSAWMPWPILRWGAAVACVVVVAAVGLHFRPTSQSSAALSSDAPIARTNAGAEIAATLTQAPPPTRSGLDAVSSSNPASPSLAKKQAIAPRDQFESRVKTEVAEQKATPTRKEADETTVLATGNAIGDKQFVPGRAKDESAPAAAKANMALIGGLPNRQAMASSAMIARATTIPTNVTPRWTLTSDGMLQRSLDSGRTWETILVAGPGTFRALTANGFEIWVGGAKGSLYHSIDAGQHWMQVQPTSENESLSADIIDIEFTDLLHGTLTTSDEQIWFTADAGHTWQKQ